MNLRPFKLERYFARYEFAVKDLLSSSDCDGLAQAALIAGADAECRALWDNLTLGYTESLGLPLLRREIASMYDGIDADNVLVCAPEEGIFLALNAVLQPGDHVICTFPGYQSLYELATGIGCEVTRWLPDEGQGWRFDPGFLESNVQKNTRMLIVNFPHNPTGALPSADDWRRIVEFARAHNLMLLSDEMYRWLEYDPNDRLPSASEVYNDAISLCGMSKTFGLAGLRIGWLTTRNAELRQRLIDLKDYTTICSSAPSELLALMGLRQRDRIAAEHLRRISDNLPALDAFIARRPDLFAWNRPRAGTICFPRFKHAVGAREFARAVVEEAGIMLLPSTVYDDDDAHFRIGFGRANFREVLGRFADYVDRVCPA